MIRNTVKTMRVFLEMVFHYDYLLFVYNIKPLTRSNLLNNATKHKILTTLSNVYMVNRIWSKKYI